MCVLNENVYTLNIPLFVGEYTNEKQNTQNVQRLVQEISLHTFLANECTAVNVKSFTK